MVQEEEEEQQREEEERHKKEGSEKRKAERLERRAQLKREGKLLTGKAKKEAERLAAVREQFLKQAGMDAPGGNALPPAHQSSFLVHRLQPNGQFTACCSSSSRSVELGASTMVALQYSVLQRIPLRLLLSTTRFSPAMLLMSSSVAQVC